jgi:hypothetical protein
MSTPTPTRPAAPARPAVVPQPRPAAERSAAEQSAVEPAELNRLPPPGGGERPGLFERSAWLIPVVAITCIVAAFVAMVLLTWIAGGNTPFDR